jgi:hypothetical protein
MHVFAWKGARLVRILERLCDGAVNLSVTLDGRAIEKLRCVRSEVFAVALPEDDVPDGPCIGVGNVPAGVFSPAVDDGFYVRLDPLTLPEVSPIK